jgi:Protein of unknown function (DUF1579)
MKFAGVLLASVLVLGVALAQGPVPKPAPDVQKIGYFVGSWTSEGDMKAGPMSPGGKVTIQEEGKWMDGGFFVVFNSSFKGTLGNGTGIAVMGYDPQENVYTYDEFNSVGEANHFKGTLEGDTWTWISEMKMGPQTVKGRFTQKIQSPTAYAFKFEMSPDGTSWNTVMDGKCSKSK